MTRGEHASVRWTSPLALASMAALCTLWLVFFASLPETYVVRLNDFPAYYGAGKLFASGQTDLLYTGNYKWFTNLPIVAAVMSPLSWLGYEQAWKVFWWIQLASFGATFGVLLYAIRRYFSPLDPARIAIASVIFLAFAPVLRRCLALGQTTPMMVLLFALVYVCMREERQRIAGLLLGFICVIKIPPLLLLPLLVLRRRLVVAGWALGVVAVAVALSFALFGSELVGQYATRVILDNLGRAQAAFNNQSLDGAFMRVFTAQGLADWTPVPRPLPVTIATLGTALAIAALLLRAGTKFLLPAAAPRDDDPRTGGLELELALGAALMVVLFPVVWIHYYLFLAVPLTLLPFWWQARDLPHPGWVVGLLILGGWLASGLEAQENAWYAAHEGERLWRLRENLQPLGAVLLVLGLCLPLAEITRRQRSA